jgi:hypothetical protein
MHLTRISTLLVLGAALPVALGATSASAQDGLPTYHVTLLGDMIEELFPGVQYPSSNARGFNENGDLVGEAPISNDGHQRGWIYTVEHGVVPLPVLPGDTRGMVRDVSDRDANGEVMIVGISTYVVDPETAVLWRFSTVTGEVLETRSIGVPPGFDESTAVAVNNDGIVVGFSSYIGPFTNWKYDVATEELETFDFPWRVADLNNVDQVCGGSFRGDLLGNWEDLTDTYEPGDVMPDWAIENGGISAGWHRINDLGWLVGRAGTGISDGAGHYKVAIVRFADPIGWTGMPPISHLSLAGGINDLGDFTDRAGSAYLEDMGQLYSLNALLSPEFLDVDVYQSNEINNNRQVAGAQGHAFLLTPLGEMIIPGDVNGDVAVNLDDYCAWATAPIDLDGDGDADADDEQWLIDRLLVFGHTLADCNSNGIADHCDIVDGASFDCDGNDVPDECQADCSGDGVPDICEPDCKANGIADPCDIADFTSLDCNENGIPDECDGGGTTEVMQVFDPPITLVPGTPMADHLVVVDVGLVDDVEFTIDIAYRIGFLTVLLSHNGTTITLIDRPGHPEVFLGNGQLGYDIILDDEGTGGPIEDQGNFGSPFEPIVSPPSYTPDEALSAFDGMPMDGVWTVHIITTDDTHPAHFLHDWGLTIARAAAPVGPCDCNGNGVPDEQDIAGGTSLDENGNGVPDECEVVPGDANGDGVVNVDDLIEVIQGWGPCPPSEPCPADVDGTGQVDVDDLATVILNWG